MEDFRDKIKNFKAAPSQISWERMQIKQEKQSLKFGKNILYLFLAFNFFAGAVLCYKLLNIPSNLNQVQYVNSPGEDQGKLEKENQNKLIAHDSINENLLSQIASLQNNLKQLSIQNSKKSTYKKDQNSENETITSKIYLKPIQSGIQNEFMADSRLKSKPPHQQYFESNNLSIPKTKNLEKKRSNLIVNRLQLDKTNNIYEYLIELASKNKNFLPLAGSQNFTKNKLNRNWYVGVGVGYENNFVGKPINFSFALNRSIHKRFDLGMTLEYSNVIERNDYRFFNNVKDFKKTTSGFLILRYKALKFNKLMLHADVGFGYEFGSLSFRRASVVDNQLEYYNDTTDFEGVQYKFSLGAMYDIAPNIALGTIFDFKESGFYNFNLNYRF